MYYVSAEGARTEKDYFAGVNNMLQDSDKAILVLGRRLKGESSVKKVVELVDECHDLIDENDIFPKDMLEEFGVEALNKYRLNKHDLEFDTLKEIESRVNRLELDLEYRHFLNEYHGEEGNDEFCVLIDRDSKSHSRTQIANCIDYCREKKYRVFLSNPCFELWLLLHVSDVAVEYSDKLDLIKKNGKVSTKHTFI